MVSHKAKLNDYLTINNISLNEEDIRPTII